MNERIKELVEKSYIYDKQNDSSFFNKEKFAELIVKECGHCMVDIMLHSGIEPEQGYDIMMKRFGVEE